MDDESRPKAAPETPAKKSTSSVTHSGDLTGYAAFAAALAAIKARNATCPARTKASDSRSRRGRWPAAARCVPLVDGRRDPLGGITDAADALYGRRRDA